MERITKSYLDLGRTVFEKSLFRQGLFRAKYDEAKLCSELQRLLGPDTTLGSEELRTSLLIVTKRFDTGSPWPLGNNPRGKYFRQSPESQAIANANYPLWQVVRASTAAPSYFDPEEITIIEQAGKSSVKGMFVDGGVSPFNNPSLRAFMYATIDGYRVGWPAGADKLLLVSVGTGARDPKIKPTWITAQEAVKSLLSLMDDCAALVETMLQWMSTSPTARQIDRELGDLRHDLLAPMPLLSYLPFNVDLSGDGVKQLMPSLTDAKKIESLTEMDDPDNMEVLQELGRLAAEKTVRSEDFASNFDLPSQEDQRAPK